MISHTNTVKIQLAQINFTYGNNAYLPYSAGLLQAFLMKHHSLMDRIEFEEIMHLRQPIEQTAARAAKADIFGVSCYIWNWEYSKELARRTKELNPDIVIVFGGPQVHHQDENVFCDLPFVDFIVVGEGEQAFAELIEFLVFKDDTSHKITGLKEITGLVINESQKVLRNCPRLRIDDIDVIPSPYLSGIFDEMIQSSTLSFQVSQETHRGCPYSCTFCDWGSSTMQKVRRFSQERIFNEFEWMGKRKIEVLYNCDANYGLFKEDMDLTNKMIEVKRRYGFPEKFRAAYAKNSNQRIFEISKLLNDEGMSKGATLSLQSVDTHTLELIKRRNMRINDFSELIHMYNHARIPTYTELIVGLPGDSRFI